MYSDKVCEHCRIGRNLYSFYGTFRVYECVKDIHSKDWLAVFEKPCDGSYCVTKKMCSWKEAKKHGDWFYRYKFPYKLIPRSEMKKSEDCIRQEKEERKEKKEEAERLRSQAEDLFIKARLLEGKER